MSPVNNAFMLLLKQKELSEKRNISLVEVEEKTGITRKTLQAWRDNKIKRFDKDVVEALCQYFCCQPGELIVMEGEPCQGLKNNDSI